MAEAQRDTSTADEPRTPGAPLPVSLIMTVRDEAGNVAPFFAALFGGSALPEEIVVCDGGSRDGTAAELRAVTHAAVRIRVLERRGATIAQGRNAAAAAAAREVLAVTDLGCIPRSDWLERLVAPLLADPDVDAVAGGYELAGRTPFERAAAAANIPADRLDAERFLPSSRSFAVRRTALRAVGGYPEYLSFAGEDTALCVALQRAGKRFARRLDAVVVWHPRTTLPAYVRQHRRYGTGDGESRVHDALYVRIAAKWSVLCATLLLGFIAAWLALLFPIALAAQYLRWRPRYGWRGVPAGTALAAYGLVLVKELSLLAGFAYGAFLSPARRAATA